MQSSKTSKKTTKGTEETLSSSSAQEPKGVEVKSKRRTSKSSTSKAEKPQTGAAKHRKASSSIATDAPIVSSGSIKLKSQPIELAAEIKVANKPSHDEIAFLAYSYWVARNHAPGNQEDDWFRAERELISKD